MKSEVFINQFDQFFMTAFKEDSAADFFPKYSQDRKNILVELRQTGEINNYMFEILEKNLKSSLKALSELDSSASMSILAVLQEFAEFK